MKKIVTILMFAAVIGMIMSSVSAVDLQEHDFDGHFKLDVPGNAFYVDASADGYKYTSNDGQGLTIQYITTDDINCASFADYIDSLGLSNPQIDGNFTIFQDDGKYVVITNSSEEMYIITDKDLDEAKAIAASANISSSDETTEASTPVKPTVDLQSNDFDEFKMDVPKDSKFEETTDSDAEFNGAKVYADSVNDINITYAENDDIDDKSVKEIVNNLKQETGAEVTTNGNLNLITAGPYNEVVFNNGTQMILITTSQLDLDTITAMAQSVEFTK